MPNTLFVCYRHGCHGEYMAHRISQHPLFRTLVADKVNGRTVIKNDYFNKKFLSQRNMINFDLLKLPAENLVVPSHYFYDELQPYFPAAKYVSIDVPIDLHGYKQKLFDRFYGYKSSSLLELVGECENKYRNYNANATDQDVRIFTSKILKKKNLSFGDIKCLAAGLSPTKKNKLLLLDREYPKPLTVETKKHSMVVPFENVESIDLQEIVDYFNK